MKRLFISIIGLSLAMTACQKKEAQTEQVAQNCTYTYSKDSTRVAWTAYKFTEKVGVGGKFDDFEVSGKTSGTDYDDILETISFKIPIASVNTNNPERDGKIKEHFFGNLSNTDYISGKIKSLNTDGKGVVTLTMNEIEKDLPVDYKFVNDEITLSAVMDVTDWDGLGAIEALNKICYDLHIGTDGISKLWPEVKLTVTSKLIKNCQ